ncbi:hypothetical protein Nepgr_001053 [Nepenthes gracilis]|uniref:Uncharacterized protein n=1 Tax=Nepenthes gracilis TaxID=150966 RepID=A0AAD3P7J7_NEPGR|nr:hypothetical protein Nepgr_001053 [Nepenthes gracilis]
MPKENRNAMTFTNDNRISQPTNNHGHTVRQSKKKARRNKKSSTLVNHPQSQKLARSIKRIQRARKVQQTWKSGPISQGTKIKGDINTTTSRPYSAGMKQGSQRFHANMPRMFPRR